MASLSRKKVLIADSSQEWLNEIAKEKESASFVLKTCTKASDFFPLFDSFKPDLVIVELMFPEMHGIEILQRIKKARPDTSVIITSFHSMIQNYNSAMDLHADYILDKPCTPWKLIKTISSFFSRTLPALPLHKVQREQIIHLPPPSVHVPKASPHIRFWGTRGSNPVSGPEYVRFGGNTPSLEIRYDQDLLLIDAGSGIRDLGQSIDFTAVKEIPLLFSHTHLDHLSGFPFFYPLHQEQKKISIWAPVGFEKPTQDTFADLFAYAYFPVAFKDIQSRLAFHDLRDKQTLSFGRIKVSTHYAYHPGPTLCFVLEVQNKRIGYVTDNEFLLGCHLDPALADKEEKLFLPYQSLISFLQGCDILIHEAQYMPEEYKTKVGWGHSSLYNVSLLIKRANIKHWIITHHDPKHTDAFLLEKEKLHAEVMERLGHSCMIELAYDGMVIPI
ncbi:MAG: response regulator, partial [Chlamydiae bacterium]|nr:response regulator [Chlamydiota bacterium]